MLITNLRPIYFLSIIIFVFLSCGDGDSGVCLDTNCSDYTSQSSAQAAFNADPECRSDLDRDNDGIACEENGNSVTICPPTSNCGCSGLNMSPCEASVCCRWVVGDGCNCR